MQQQPITPVTQSDLIEPEVSKDIWDKIDILGKLLGSILIPLTVAIAGFYVNTALQDRSAKQKTAEIAISILQSDNPATPELRAWAEGVFRDTLASASQPLSPKALQELRSNPLPSNVAGVDLVSAFEGFSSTPIRDPFGGWSIGFGHTDGVGPDTPAVTVDQAKDLLANDLKAANSAIDQLVKVPLSPNQREALVSFVWNVGVKNFSSSTLLQTLNAGQYEKVPDEMRRWAMRSGTLLPGLKARREREISVWNQ
ncbi:lysozyme [Rhizobium sp. 768_B6_N1_8]|jgi:lysozyme|uniref:lysozyme n=1 Tax=unclassified Rhizobium TaxID=2613769 RepID=UPI003F29ABE0